MHSDDCMLDIVSAEMFFTRSLMIVYSESYCRNCVFLPHLTWPAVACVNCFHIEMQYWNSSDAINMNNTWCFRSCNYFDLSEIIRSYCYWLSSRQLAAVYYFLLHIYVSNDMARPSLAMRWRVQTFQEYYVCL